MNEPTVSFQENVTKVLNTLQINLKDKSSCLYW